MTHWRISEGNIEIVQGYENKYANFATTVDFYKERVEDLRKQHGDFLAKDDRKFKVVTMDDGNEWKEFTPENREDIFKV